MWLGSDHHQQGHWSDERQASRNNNKEQNKTIPEAPKRNKVKLKCGDHSLVI